MKKDSCSGGGLLCGALAVAGYGAADHELSARARFKAGLYDNTFPASGGRSVQGLDRRPTITTSRIAASCSSHSSSAQVLHSNPKRLNIMEFHIDRLWITEVGDRAAAHHQHRSPT
jgi:hypothetical protein